MTTESKAAAAVRIGVRTALRERAGLLESLRPCFARTQVWLQAGKYVAAVMSDLPEHNGGSIARHAGDAVRGSRTGRGRAAQPAGGLRAGVLDETGQEKHGTATAGVKRQYLRCAGRVASGISMVHLSYVREGTGHALIGARQRIPREQVSDLARSLAAGLPPGLRFRTRGGSRPSISARTRTPAASCSMSSAGTASR